MRTLTVSLLATLVVVLVLERGVAAYNDEGGNPTWRPVDEISLNKALGLRTGDIVVFLDSPGKLGVGYVNKSKLQPGVIHVTTLWELGCFSYVYRDAADLATLGKSVMKVVRPKNVEYNAYAHWLLGGPQPQFKR